MRQSTISLDSTFDHSASLIQIQNIQMSMMQSGCRILQGLAASPTFPVSAATVPNPAEVDYHGLKGVKSRTSHKFTGISTSLKFSSFKSIYLHILNYRSSRIHHVQKHSFYLTSRASPSDYFDTGLTPKIF